MRAGTKTKRSTSQYSGVYLMIRKSGEKSSIRHTEERPWRAQIIVNGVRLVCQTYATEREAAVAVDMALIRNGYPPRNILKKVDKQRDAD